MMVHTNPLISPTCPNSITYNMPFTIMFLLVIYNPSTFHLYYNVLCLFSVYVFLGDTDGMVEMVHELDERGLLSSGEYMVIFVDQSSFTTNPIKYFQSKYSDNLITHKHLLINIIFLAWVPYLSVLGSRPICSTKRTGCSTQHSVLCALHSVLCALQCVLCILQSPSMFFQIYRQACPTNFLFVPS